MIYLCGGWVDTGPGYNDTYFAVEFVTTDKEKAIEYLRCNPEDTVFEAEDGSRFIEWDTVSIEKGEIR